MPKSLIVRMAATIAVTLSGIALALTVLYLGSHAWHLSADAAAAATLLAVPALFLICIVFRDQSTRRKVNITLTLVAATAALFVIFPRGGD